MWGSKCGAGRLRIQSLVFRVRGSACRGLGLEGLGG